MSTVLRTVGAPHGRGDDGGSVIVSGKRERQPAYVEAFLKGTAVLGVVVS